ncbi:MAG: ACP S-malonyltransferase [Acidobacteria bacterium]|nr:ACP S-malonyltransferase [Acidobacteriota bacterium]
MNKAVVVLCPGRGSYTASELGYLSRPVQAAVLSELNAAIDRSDGLRTARGDLTIRGMDGARTFSPEFFRGENASGLTFACTAFDFLRLDDTELDIVAVGGNSMGWYSALFAAGVFGLDDAFDLVETMGGMLQNGQIGGQVIYPLVDDDWRAEPGRAAAAATALESVREAGHQAGWSIRYGGYAVLWADADGLPLLLGELPPVKNAEMKYPLELPGHSAFHSSLMLPVSERALDQLSSLPWRPPSIPLIDGRGCRWHPLGTDPAALCRYTLETQVLEPYDFSASVRVALREYAPDAFVLLGPGDALGAAVAHAVIAERWQGIDSREAFVERQEDDPLLISLGRAEQAALVTLPTA